MWLVNNVGKTAFLRRNHIPGTELIHSYLPHEADDLDVILLGHSLGGILAADVARLQQDGKPKSQGSLHLPGPFWVLSPWSLLRLRGDGYPEKGHRIPPV
jgi:alpha-beta hydrolase superfamily lysophospholipase